MNALQREDSKTQAKSKTRLEGKYLAGPKEQPQPSLTYAADKIVGNGSFGVVYQVRFVLLSSGAHRRDRRTRRHQKGLSGQEVQEQGADDNEGAESSERGDVATLVYL
jgi:hypothetical protein